MSYWCLWRIVLSVGWKSEMGSYFFLVGMLKNVVCWEREINLE